MKKISILLLAVFFIGIANVNAQSDATTETVVVTEEIKTCAKSGKVCDATCENKKNGTCCKGQEKKSCSKSEKAACSKSKAKCSKSEKGDFDYGTTNTRLLTGSFNLSKTAEHNQFDNLVLYKGTHLKALYGAFYGDFTRLWNLNRTKEDKPSSSVYNKYLKADSRGQYIIHGKVPMSLRWEEVVKLRRDVNKVAPGIFRGGMKKRNCYYYAPKTGTFTGC